jgi:hypothetical protein
MHNASHTFNIKFSMQFQYIKCRTRCLIYCATVFCKLNCKLDLELCDLQNHKGLHKP